jgi:regulator of sigma E protease
MLITIIIFFVLLSVLVLVHEFGHFITARRFGVGAEEFGLGFPPRLFGWYRNSAGKGVFIWGNKEVTDAPGTVYSFNLIPIGGFVKIKGENGDEKSDPTSFATKSLGKRTLILSAGVIMNVILAAVIISAGLMAGLPQALDDSSLPQGVTISDRHIQVMQVIPKTPAEAAGLPQALDDSSLPQGVTISDRHIQVMQVIPKTPAEAAGLQAGDVIVSINNRQFATYADLQNFVADKAGQKLSYQISRGDESMNKEITPQLMSETNKAGIGISIAETGIVRYPWYRAIVEGVKTTGFLLWAIIVGLATLVAQLFSGHSVSAQVVGPVGIAALTGQMAQLGFAYLAQFAALLSLHLVVINFLPFPALDGGRVLFLLIEKFKGTPVRQKTEAIIHNVGFMILIALVIVVTLKDIIKLF